MKIGDLVKWNADDEEHGSLGIVVETDSNHWIVVHWTDGLRIPYYECQKIMLEVL